MAKQTTPTLTDTLAAMMAQQQALAAQVAALTGGAAPAAVAAAPPAILTAKHGGMTFTPTVKLEGGRWLVTFEAWPAGQVLSSTGKSFLLGGGGTKVALPDGTQARLTVSLSVTK